ncbi:ATP-binding cassette domain-containing protein [Dehalobacter sp. DCM]|uniref:ATP-binding cassette domain-containing protein n=1 Tax=Dehalobacter sp. DCM TaxID=2907827 RepID=UPI003081EA5F|nr:ATP-binding cassette domain-containing protein [Dehalobacter sp. DCM]
MLNIIEINHLNYTYLPGTPYEHPALKDISFAIAQGEFVGIFGPNGSGKSTLAQMLNGLIQPTHGTISICGMSAADAKSRKELWKKAALVFQYPEQQIFQISVFDEVAYGPRNMGLPEQEIKKRVEQALLEVGLNPDAISKQSPTSLSGGIRRRIAIAGMLAIQPAVLILDEPMAGLDAIGRKLILTMIKNRKAKGETTLMISHDLKEMMMITDKIILLDQGTLVFFGSVADLLNQKGILKQYRLQVPDYVQVITALSAKGLPVNMAIRTIEEAGDEIIKFHRD